MGVPGWTGVGGWVVRRRAGGAFVQADGRVEKTFERDGERLGRVTKGKEKAGND